MSLGSGDVDREWIDQGLGESVVVTLGRADAVKLLEAKKVEMEVGPRQYNIKSGHLSGLKSLLREINRLDPAATESIELTEEQHRHRELCTAGSREV